MSQAEDLTLGVRAEEEEDTAEEEEEDTVSPCAHPYRRTAADFFLTYLPTPPHRSLPYCNPLHSIRHLPTANPVVKRTQSPSKPSIYLPSPLFLSPPFDDVTWTPAGGGGGGYGGGGGGYGGGGGGDRSTFHLSQWRVRHSLIVPLPLAVGQLGDNLRQIKWDMSTLTVFEKNFYAEDKMVASRTEKEVTDFRRYVTVLPPRPSPRSDAWILPQ